MKKIAAVGIILLFLASSLPALNASDTSDQKNIVPLRPNLVCNLGSAILNYGTTKWKWGQVAFNNSTTDFDLNYTALGSTEVNVGYGLNLSAFVQGKAKLASYLISLEFINNGTEEIHEKSSSGIFAKENWTTQEFMGYDLITKDVYNTTDIHARITVTGYPLNLWFREMTWIPHVLWLGQSMLPYERRHGTALDFTIHVHS